MDREPELTATFRRLLSDFRRSTEYARAASPGNARWVESLLDVLTTCEWALDDLDPYALDAALGEGMGWTIDRAPDDPAAVARELLAFLLWARRVGAAHGHLDYQRCCTYLASATAPRDIAARLRPIEIRFHDAGWRRQVW